MTALQYVVPVNTMLRSAWPGDRPAPVRPSNSLPVALQRVAPLGPACLVSRRPIKAQRVALLPPADGIMELRTWAQRDFRAVNRRWAAGKTALASPMRPRRIDPPVEEMTWQQIRDSQGRELPSISAEAFEDLGIGALSLDASAKFDDEPEAGTIAERIGAESVGLLMAEVEDVEPAVHPVWADALEDARLNLPADAPEADVRHLAMQLVKEQIDALRSSMARRYGTPMDVPSPQVRERIEWERFVAQCSGITAKQGLRLLPNDVRFYTYPVCKGQEFIDRKQAFIAWFLRSIGAKAMPSPKEFAQRRSALKALARQVHWREEAQALDRVFDGMEAERQWLVQREGAMSWDETDWEYTPSYAVLREAAWQDLKPDGWVPAAKYAELRAESRKLAYERWLTAREAAQPQRVHRCRNPRTHGSRDEAWHTTGRDPEELEIGEDWTFAY